MLGRFYQWFWFHTEFWLTPVNRRPYTFIMRDWIFTHIGWFVLALVVWFGLLFFWNLYQPTPALIIGLLSSFLLAHLVWGTKWIEHQQELPTYLGEKNII